MKPRTSPLKLTQVSHFFVAHGGGIERVAHEISERLSSDASYTVEWLAANCDPPPANTNRVSHIAINIINAIEKMTSLPYPIPLLTAWSAIWSSTKRADVIVCHDYIYLTSVLALLFGRLHKKPVLLVQHTGNFPYRSTFARYLFGFLNRTLGALMLRHASQAVFISNSALDFFKHFVRFNTPPVLIPNGVNTQLFYPPKEHRKILSSERQRTLVFVGRFVEKKGILYIREMARITPNLKWVIIGNGPINPKDWELPNITVMIRIPQASLSDIYRSADLLVLPSEGEGFPLVVQEAMACGLPSLVRPEVAHGLPIPPDYIYTCSLEGNDVPRLWVEKIEKILVEADLTPDMPQRLSTFAQRAWCWDTTINKYDSVIRKVIFRNP